MAALTTIALAVGAAAAVGSYATQKAAAKRQERQAEEQKLQAQFDSDAVNQQAVNETEREKAAAAAEEAQRLASEQMDDTVDVSINPNESTTVRRKRVQAQFNVADGGASSGAGSLRV